MAQTGPPERLTVSDLTLPLDHHGWSSDIGGLVGARLLEPSP